MNDEFIKCPYCAEDIRAEATVCKHCGRELGPKKRSGIGKIVIGIVLLGIVSVGGCICLLSTIPLAGSSVSGTPRPTSPLVMAPPYADIWNATEPMSDAQFEAYADGLRNNRIEGWTGTVNQVDKGEITGDYTIYVDMTPGDFGTEVFIDVDEATALSINLGDTITFDGRLRSADNSLGLALFVDGATIR